MKERAPEIRSGIPVREVNPAMTQDIERQLNGYFDFIEADESPTPIDFPALPEGATEKDFLKWIESVLGIDPDIIEGDALTEESKKEYSKLNLAFHQGKEFLSNTLKYKDTEIPKDPGSIKSKKELFDLLQKTIFSKKKGLDRRAFVYCRLVKAAIAAYEANRYEAKLLKRETVYFESTMISREQDTPLMLLREEDGKKFFVSLSDDTVKGTLGSRGKGLEGIMLRFITRPESNAEMMSKDGIGSRISIDTEGARKLLPSLCKWLIKTKRVPKLYIENKNYFPSDEWKENLTTMPSEDGTAGKIDFPTPGPTKFQGAVIGGTIPFFREDGTEYGRHFEIQIVLPRNKNEKRKMNHAVYNVSRKVVARTRLDGGCPERVFREFIKDASVESGMKEDKIESYLVGKKIYFQSSQDEEHEEIVKLRTNKGGASFVVYSVYERWRKLGFAWVSPGLLKKIDQSRRVKSR